MLSIHLKSNYERLIHSYHILCDQSKQLRPINTDKRQTFTVLPQLSSTASNYLMNERRQPLRQGRIYGVGLKNYALPKSECYRISADKV